jgi:hypothetical protein
MNNRHVFEGDIVNSTIGPFSNVTGEPNVAFRCNRTCLTMPQNTTLEECVCSNNILDSVNMVLMPLCLLAGLFGRLPCYVGKWTNSTIHYILHYSFPVNKIKCIDYLFWCRLWCLEECVCSNNILDSVNMVLMPLCLLAGLFGNLVTIFLMNTKTFFRMASRYFLIATDDNVQYKNACQHMILRKP